MVKQRRPFGLKNAPPAVLHAPAGLPNKTATPTLKRKMSLTVGLVSLGAAAVAGGVYYENRRSEEECRARMAQLGQPPEVCAKQHSSSGSHSSGRSWYSSGGSWSSGSSAHIGGHATFGGFGHSGAAHAGGS